MSKHDLAARPIYHHLQDSIEAHLTIVFASLAVARRLEVGCVKKVEQWLVFFLLVRLPWEILSNPVDEMLGDVLFTSGFEVVSGW